MASPSGAPAAAAAGEEAAAAAAGGSRRTQISCWRASHSKAVALARGAAASPPCGMTVHAPSPLNCQPLRWGDGGRERRVGQQGGETTGAHAEVNV
jgi:hypothetical protein